MNLNLFYKTPQPNDELQLKKDLISTRILIVALTLSVIILIMYTSFVQDMRSVTVKNPTLATYYDLYLKYSNTLSCPCSKVSIEHKNIFTIEYTQHQICSSSFTSDRWLNYLLDKSDPQTVLHTDFRYTGVFMFRTLANFCRLTKETIENGLRRFGDEKYTETSLVPPSILQEEGSRIITDLFSSSVRVFTITTRMMRDLTNNNLLFSSFSTELLIETSTQNRLIALMPKTFNDCSCALDYSCTTPLAVYAILIEEIAFEIPGLKSGCYIVEALVQSSLECFYNQTCVDQLQASIDYSSSSQMIAMTPGVLTRYTVNSTVNKILDHLMVETWNWSVLYPNYFNECRPVACTYTYKTRNDALYTVTTLIGLLGGLVNVLKICVPYTVVIGFYLIRCIKRQR